ncbi:MAG: hypothetical protein A2Y77_09535 [Planctomycetes bacterium RBG_13_62_9]|nr:MAG: hypothetical protein A2Y77_09535 [Planctomycetes bacterium RBG_13_62_9]
MLSDRLLIWMLECIFGGMLGPLLHVYVQRSNGLIVRMSYGGLASLEKAQSVRSWIGCGKLYEPRIDDPLVLSQGSPQGESASFLGQQVGLRTGIARETIPTKNRERRKKMTQSQI